MIQTDSAAPFLAHEVLDEVANLLMVAEDQRDSLKERLQKIAEEFSANRLMQAASGHPKEQIQKVALTIPALTNAADAVEKLSPDISGVILALAHEAEPELIGSLDLASFAHVLRCWSEASARFLQNYERPRGRPADFPLERAVRALLPIIEDEFASPVEITWKKRSDENPEPGNGGARALVLLLRAFPKRPTQTAILNMAVKVKNRPEEAPTQGDRARAAYIGAGGSDGRWV